MKKITYLALAISLVTLFAGCAKQDVGDAEKDPAKGSVQAPDSPSGAPGASATEPTTATTK